MKKIYVCSIFAIILLSALSEIKAQSQLSAFTGTWVLDKEKTNTTKDFPESLKNFEMLIAEGENLLNVKSQITGSIVPQPVRDRPSGNSGPATDPNMVTNSRPIASDNTRTTGGNSGISKTNYGGTMALYFTSGEASYNFDGKEAKVEIKQGDKIAGFARIKAKLEKNGKTLQLTTIRRLKTANGEIEITSREVWKLSDDGKSIRFQRTVETPVARDEVIMTLTKTS